MTVFRGVFSRPCPPSPFFHRFSRPGFLFPTFTWGFSGFLGLALFDFFSWVFSGWSHLPQLFHGFSWVCLVWGASHPFSLVFSAVVPLAFFEGFLRVLDCVASSLCHRFPGDFRPVPSTPSFFFSQQGRPLPFLRRITSCSFLGVVVWVRQRVF